MSARCVVVSKSLLQRTIEELRDGGPFETERVVLWLGTRNRNNSITVTELYVPGQAASSDFFHISRTDMAHLMKHLRSREMMIAAQLHTHPLEAFHSAADDRWAIVRHVGALSIVLPYFATTTTIENFDRETKTFRLDRSNRWIELIRVEKNGLLQVIE